MSSRVAILGPRDDDHEEGGSDRECAHRVVIELSTMLLLVLYRDIKAPIPDHQREIGVHQVDGRGVYDDDECNNNESNTKSPVRSTFCSSASFSS